jgi:hypothetical protein
LQLKPRAKTFTYYNMARQQLNIEYDFDFTIIGLVCQAKDYRLCFEINKIMGFDFEKTTDTEIFDAKQGDAGYFSTYLYENEDETSFYIIFNRGSKGVLVPEQNKLDCFIVVKGPFREDQRKQLLSDLKKVTLILGTYELEVKKLKSRENFLMI